MSHVHKDNKGN